VQLGHPNLITYPNPVSDIISIDLSSVTGDGTISILTLEGKEILSQHTSGNNLITLNLCQLSQGIYLCRFINLQEIKTVKIIKQ
jgi:hypothetical protein